MITRQITLLKLLLALLFTAAVAFGANGKLNPNTATLEELDAIPGIGQKTAQRIIEMRPIQSMDELHQLPGFGPARIATLAEYISLDEGATTPTEAVAVAKTTGTTFEITIAGSRVPVTRLGVGPIGVIFFGHSGSRQMVKYIRDNAEWLGELPDKCSLFLWEYPSLPPFDKIEPTIKAYVGGDFSAKLPLPGIATSVVEQIQKASGLSQFLIIGNSLGAGVVLQDYFTLVGDKSLSFILISPTEAFMPSPEKLPMLERTVLIGSKGYETGDGDTRFSADPFLKGDDRKPSAKAWHWFRKNNNQEWGDLITTSRASESEERTGLDGSKYSITLPTNYEAGHKTIGGEINAELLAKLIRVKLGLADKAILGELPLQWPSGK